jgi:hypothetical protein
MEGRFAMDRVMDAPVDQDILTGESRPDRWERLLLLEVFLVGHCTSVMDVRDERRVWITCRWPNPSFQLTTRGSAVTARAFQAPSVAGSPHRRPRSPSRRDGEKCA